MAVLDTVTEDGRYLLGAWRDGLLTSEQVVRWADRTIEATAVEQLPGWVIELSLHGPDACSRRPSSEFVDVPQLEFAMALAMRAATLDMTSSAQLAEFVSWFASACMGEDLSKPEVQLGYQVDHLWGDCHRMDLAQALVREQLPPILPTLPAIPRVVRERLGAVEPT